MRKPPPVDLWKPRRRGSEELLRLAKRAKVEGRSVWVVACEDLAVFNQALDEARRRVKLQNENAWLVLSQACAYAVGSVPKRVLRERAERMRTRGDVSALLDDARVLGAVRTDIALQWLAPLGMSDDA